MLKPRDIVSMAVFYGGTILILSLIVHVGSSYGCSQVHDRFKEMKPRLHPGDYARVDKRARQADKLDYDDIIMYRCPPWKTAPYRYEFARVVGKPGDVVRCEDGKLCRTRRVAGKLGEEEQVPAPRQERPRRPRAFGEFMVPRNTVFVLYDRRTSDEKLRNFLVPVRAIHGKVYVR